MMNSVASGGRLPSEYQEVEWIGNDTSGTAYLNINSYVFKADYIKTEIECDFTRNDEQLIIAYPFNNSQNRFGLGGKLTINRVDYFNLAFGNQSTVVAPRFVSLYDNYFHTWVYENGVFEIQDLNDTVDVSSRTFNDVTNRTIRLLYGYYGSEVGKIKYFIQKRNGTEILNLVPCYRKSDNEIGMYDLVNDTFYTNAGTGTFTKGADVN